MQTEADTDQRTHLHDMWASVAPAWGAHADYADTRGEHLTNRMLDLTGLRPGQRVLELACGAGGVGLAAAARVSPNGEVVISDVAAAMAAIAAERANQLGLGNVTTAVLDLEQIAQPDACYDAVVCREGLMLVPDPTRAATEICRVLRPGGRVAVAVWGAREQNPWLGVVFDTVSAQTGTPVPPPGVPGPFSLQDPAVLREALETAQLADVVVEEVETPLRAASVDEWWTRTVALAGPLARVLSSLPDSAKIDLQARARLAARDYETPTGLEFPGLALLASARRPGRSELR